MPRLAVELVMSDGVNTTFVEDGRWKDLKEHEDGSWHVSERNKTLNAFTGATRGDKQLVGAVVADMLDLTEADETAALVRFFTGFTDAWLHGNDDATATAAGDDWHLSECFARNKKMDWYVFERMRDIAADLSVLSLPGGGQQRLPNDVWSFRRGE
jgi:hypothetical protein